MISPHFIEDVYAAYPKYLGRYVNSLQIKDFTPINESCFIKPACQKYFEAKVYGKDDIVFNESCQPTDWIYVQGVLDPIDEVRCFILGGKILTASYYRKNKIFEPEYFANEDIPDVLHKMTKDICELANTQYGIVLDFVKLPDGTWVFLEVNEAWASGLYDCDPNECLKVIVESQFQ